MVVKNRVLHFPRLDTVLMVEVAIKNSGNYLSRTELWKKLPKKVMYQTFKIVLDYLIDSRKILVSTDGKLVWVFADSKKTLKLIGKSVPAHA